MQVFDEKLRSKLPHATRLVQTVLWHPKAVRVLRSQLQPPARAYEYTEGAANLWGPGPSPVLAMEWSYSSPWSGERHSPWRSWKRISGLLQERVP